MLNWYAISWSLGGLGPWPRPICSRWLCGSSFPLGVLHRYSLEKTVPLYRVWRVLPICWRKCAENIYKPIGSINHNLKKKNCKSNYWNDSHKSGSEATCLVTSPSAERSPWPAPTLNALDRNKQVFREKQRNIVERTTNIWRCKRLLCHLLTTWSCAGHSDHLLPHPESWVHHSFSPSPTGRGMYGKALYRLEWYNYLSYILSLKMDAKPFYFCLKKALGDATWSL